VKRGNFIRCWQRSGFKNPDKPNIFKKTNVKNHSYHQLYPVLAKIRINRIRINRGSLYWYPWLLKILHYVTIQRPVTRLGRRRDEEFSEGEKIFKLCPIVSKYVQHIFPGEAKIFLGVASPPLFTGLVMLHTSWYLFVT